MTKVGICHKHQSNHQDSNNDNNNKNKHSNLLSLAPITSSSPTTKTKTNPAFTIVELLVVIVVIGVLAAITIVSYNGITNKATAASLQSDLNQAAKRLKIFQADNGFFPTSVTDCPTPSNANNICIKASNNATFTTYSVNNSSSPQTFVLAITSADGMVYQISENSSPIAAGNIVCPAGFILVPGSTTYGTNSFCVMKYEAKNNGSGVAVSQPNGTPWVSISQTTAITTAQNACTGCHLITEAEWMTIAQNVLSVPSNWSGGAVGSGYIYSGHNDNSPANALEASNDDTDGYYGTGNTSGNQKRTLTLTNGQVIWDFSGDVYDITAGTIAGGQQPGVSGETAYAWKQWNSSSITWNGFPASSRPDSTGISGAANWSSTQGIGQLYSYAGDTNQRTIRKGGAWTYGSFCGILTISLSTTPSYSSSDTGFRVTK